MAKKQGARCVTCGQYVQNVREYFDSLPVVLSHRFIDLLDANKNADYQNGVFDCINKVFGMQNRIMNKELWMHGYAEKYAQRFGQQELLHKLGIKEVVCPS